MKVRIVIDNEAHEGYAFEHGLSLLCEFEHEKLLFDTGAGNVFTENFAKTGEEAQKIHFLVLSHGHYDHTGGVGQFLSSGFSGTVFYGKGMEKRRYSIHSDRPVKELTIPCDAFEALEKIPEERRREITSFTRINEDFFLTGEIAHTSFEDRGGPFFLDKEGRNKDELTDEIALLSSSGVLIQGCCHAGIINTLSHCEKNVPHIPVRYIIGGLHLLYADEEKLAKTVQYLNNVKSLEKLILLHCTGKNAVEYLQKHLSCKVVTGKAGDTFTF